MERGESQNKRRPTAEQNILFFKMLSGDKGNKIVEEDIELGPDERFLFLGIPDQLHGIRARFQKPPEVAVDPLPHIPRGSRIIIELQPDEMRPSLDGDGLDLAIH